MMSESPCLPIVIVINVNTMVVSLLWVTWYNVKLGTIMFVFFQSSQPIKERLSFQYKAKRFSIQEDKFSLRCTLFSLKIYWRNCNKLGVRCAKLCLGTRIVVRSFYTNQHVVAKNWLVAWTAKHIVLYLCFCPKCFPILTFVWTC